MIDAALRTMIDEVLIFAREMFLTWLRLATLSAI
jgi:hypothetical protein